KEKGTERIQTILDAHCLAGVRIASGNQLETLSGPAKPTLAEQGWRVFLVKVMNPSGVSGLALQADSPDPRPMLRGSTSTPTPKVISVGEVGQRFLELQMYDTQPLTPLLSGLELEYRILQVYCRDAGRKEAQLGFSLARNVPDKRPPRQKVATS